MPSEEVPREAIGGGCCLRLHPAPPHDMLEGHPVENHVGTEDPIASLRSSLLCHL